MTQAPLYCPYWCEENIWQLCEHPPLLGRERYVLIVSNLDQQIAMWAQRAAERPGLPVGWDYHVVLLVREGASWEIWDLDTMLGTPVAATTWLDHSFLDLPPAARAYAPMFRVIPAAVYRSRFSSDRSHMRDKAGRYHHPPPPWPAIIQGPSNLHRLIDMSERSFGESETKTETGTEIMDLAELRAWLR